VSGEELIEEVEVEFEYIETVLKELKKLFIKPSDYEPELRGRCQAKKYQEQNFACCENSRKKTTYLCVFVPLWPNFHSFPARPAS
jgi:hypothetical protein